MSRRPAFDPTRLDDELDELLPPPPPLPARMASELAPPKPAPAGHASSAAERADNRPERSARGAGGRPRGGGATAADVTGPAVVAVRVPKPLYDAVVLDLLAGHVERPSYAQIVAWTCEDHADDVVAELEHATRTAARAPRGRRLATEVVALTLRFQSAERRALNDVMTRASRREAGGFTRTAAVIAALRIAVRHGLPQDSTARDIS